MAEVKKINCDLLVADKQFTNKENGEVVTYKSVTAIINGVNVELSVKTSSKSLFNYLIAQLGN